MSSLSRDRILSRLNAARERLPVPWPDAKDFHILKLSRQAKMERLKTLMDAMRTEVHVVRAETWVDTLTGILRNRGFKELLYASGTEIGTALEGRWKGDTHNLPELVPYDRNMEEFKSHVFEIDASITSTAGAIADTGAIILWPDQKEPRTMSLVPPVHIAILKAERIFDSLWDIIQEQGWSGRMPANAVLISGPSKTADIELTLAFGVHGPRELILLILED